MKDTQNTIDLARIRAELAAGLINITDHMTQLDRLIARGGEASEERRELWRIETLQAGLGRQQSQLMDRIAHEERPSVVLVVEDEILVLMSAIANLEAAGFIVHQASNADEALALLESYESIRAVFTDVQMPGTMNGLELARVIHLRWPAVKVLVTSGNALYGAEDVVWGDRFLRKPYRAEDLVAALRAN
jgi:two-component system, response regulator PdtaR